MTRILAISVLLAALATPVAAAPFCGGGTGTLPLGATSSATVHFGLSFHVGDDFDESDVAQFDEMNLRREGYDVTRAERWNGCIRAWIRDDSGRESMRFFDPDTLREVF